jgi:hypothetical protein
MIDDNINNDEENSVINLDNDYDTDSESKNEYYIDEFCNEQKYKYIIFELINNENINKYDLNNGEILNTIALFYYLVKKNYMLTKKYFRSAIKLNCMNAIKNLAQYYYNVGITSDEGYLYTDETNMCDLKKANSKTLKYYKMALELGDVYVIQLLASFYKYKNEKEMVKYYLMDNTEYSYYELASYYYDNNNDELMLKYGLIFIEFRESDCNGLFDSIYNKYKNKLKLYCIFINIENPQQIIVNEIKELEKNKEIQKYKNKIRIFSEFNNIKECIVCKEDKLNIILDCAHEICIDCYPIIDKCYYNC